MSNLFKILFSSIAFWIYFDTTWYILTSILYYFSIPWIVWGSLIIFVIIRLIKNPPPDPKIVNQVLGLDPIKFQTNELNGESQMNGRQFCMKVVAHRGGGYDYPENSLSAFSNCKRKGCNIVEFDVTRTKDKVPIIFHDETIERLTGKSGIVKNMTWEELKQLDISCNHPLKEKFDGSESIALLDDAIEFCLNNDLHLFMDVKDSNVEMVQVILNAYKKYPKLYENAAVTSFYPIIIYLTRRYDCRIITCLSYRPRTFSTLCCVEAIGQRPRQFSKLFKHLIVSIIDMVHDWTVPRFTYHLLEISAILLHKDIISSTIINEWNNKGIRVIAWTVNLPSEKMHFTKILKIAYLTDTLLTEKNDHYIGTVYEIPIRNYSALLPPIHENTVENSKDNCAPLAFSTVGRKRK